MNDHGWIDETWNPTTGCTKVSPGCKNCYAELMSERLQAMGQRKYLKGFRPTFHAELLERPYRWRKPREVFVSSMSDLFHQDFSLEAVIKPAFKVMNECARHRFQVLTRRAARVATLASELTWTPNIWVGTSVETAAYASRADELREVPAAVRFLSLEPLLGPQADLDLAGIHWVIVGGESGPSARPMDAGWVREIRDKCVERKVAFCFKQWGGTARDTGAPILDGRVWSEYPAPRASVSARARSA